MKNQGFFCQICEVNEGPKEGSRYHQKPAKTSRSLDEHFDVTELRNPQNSLLRILCLKKCRELLGIPQAILGVCSFEL
jgi:hypothetical protein